MCVYMCAHVCMWVCFKLINMLEIDFRRNLDEFDSEGLV